MTLNLPKLAVLVSGNGSNLQSIIDHIQKSELPATIAVVVSNQPKAHAMERAKKAKIPVSLIDHKEYKNRSDYDRALIKELQKYSVKYVVLAGFMRILGPEFLSKYPDRVLNIHPSLLPKYPGMNAIEKALSSKESETGVTVHFVNEGMDAGPIILQERVPIESNDTFQTLQARIQKVEHLIYPKAIKKVLWEKEA